MDINNMKRHIYILFILLTVIICFWYFIYQSLQLYDINQQSLSRSKSNNHQAHDSKQTRSESENEITVIQSNLKEWNRDGKSLIEHFSGKLTKMESDLYCLTAQDAQLHHKYCHCINCCVFQNEVTYFSNNNGKNFNVTIQMFERKRQIPIRSVHLSKTVDFSEALWVATPTHLTSNFYKHVLSQWFWLSDIYHTWIYDKLWRNIYPDFNWMLEYNLGQRENIVEYWYAVSHPKRYAPLRLYRGVGKRNRQTKVCYAHLLIGHNHITQGIWHHTSDHHHLGTNTKPDERNMNTVASRALFEYATYFIRKTPTLRRIRPRCHNAVFISRKDSSRRRIINQQEVLDMVKKYGFHIDVLELSNLSQADANMHIRNASLVLGAHGAGFANILTLMPHSIVLEFHPFGFQKWVYAFVAKLMNLKYLYWVAPTEDYVKHTAASLKSAPRYMNYYRHRDIIVDLEELNVLLEESRHHILLRSRCENEIKVLRRDAR